MPLSVAASPVEASADDYPPQIDHCREAMVLLADDAQDTIASADWTDEKAADAALKKVKALDFASRMFQRPMDAYGGGESVERRKELKEYRELVEKLTGRTASRRAHGVEADA